MAGVDRQPRLAARSASGDGRNSAPGADRETIPGIESQSQGEEHQPRADVHAVSQPESATANGARGATRGVAGADRAHTEHFGVRDQSSAEAMYRRLHLKYGHLSKDRVRAIATLHGEWRSEYNPIADKFSCPSCACATMQRVNRPPARRSTLASRPLEVIYVDTVPRPPVSVDDVNEQRRPFRTPLFSLRDPHFVNLAKSHGMGAIDHALCGRDKVPYVLLVTDEYSKYTWVLPVPDKTARSISLSLKAWKSRTVPWLNSQLTRMRRLGENAPPWVHTIGQNLSIGTMHMDSGTEFHNFVILWAQQNDVHMAANEPGAPHENGVVEGRWRIIENMLKKAQMDVFGGLSNSLWLGSLLYATYMVNISPTSAATGDGEERLSRLASPYERLLALVPSREMYFMFGNPCYYYDTTAKNVAHLRGIAGYVVGYELMGDDVNLRGFRVCAGDLAHFAPDSRRTIMTTNNVLIDDLAVQPLHVGAQYMQPFSHGNPDGITFGSPPARALQPVHFSPDDRRRQHRMNQVYRDPDSERHYRKGPGGELVLDHMLTQNAIHWRERRNAAASIPSSGGARLDASADDVAPPGGAPQDDEVQALAPNTADGPLDHPSDFQEAESEDVEDAPLHEVENRNDDHVTPLTDDATTGIEGIDARQDEQDTQDDREDAPSSEDEAAEEEAETQAPPQVEQRRSSRSNKGIPAERFVGISRPSKINNSTIDETTQQILRAKLSPATKKILTEFDNAALTVSVGDEDKTYVDIRALHTGKATPLLKSDTATRLVIFDAFSAKGSFDRTLNSAGLSEVAEVIRLDIDPKSNPTICADIRKLVRELKAGIWPDCLKGKEVDLLWLSPPCTPYSVANTMRTREQADAEMKEADELVQAGFELIKILNPKAWFIENPDSGKNRLKHRGIMKNYQHLVNTVTYCHYGRRDRKATMIVSNVPDLQLKDCRKHGQECLAKLTMGRHTQTAQAGPSKAADGSIIPGTPKEISQQVPDALVLHLMQKVLREYEMRPDYLHFQVGDDESTKTQLVVAAVKSIGERLPRPRALEVFALLDVKASDQLGREVRSLKDVPRTELNEAKDKEIQGLLKRDVFEIVPMKDMDPEAPLLTHVWVLKVRDDDSVKARLCVGGHKQSKGVNFWEISSPTPRATTVKLHLGYASSRKWNVYTADVSQAYVFASMGVKMYMKMPAEMAAKHPNCVLLLKKSLYGAKQSGRNWFNEASDAMRSIGYRQLDKDPCCFDRGAGNDKKSAVLLYVDDFLFLGPESEFDRFMDEMSKRYDITASSKSQSTIKVWNGLEIQRHEDGKITVTQVAKIRNMAREYQAEIEELGKGKAVTPEFTAENLFNPNDMIDPKSISSKELRTLRRYQEMTGSAMYVTTYTRYDIAYAMSKAARLMHAASYKHIRGIARIIKYLSNNESLALTFDGTQCCADGAPHVFAFADSDFGGEPFIPTGEVDLGRKSTSGVLIMAYGGPIYWKSKLQSKVATSSGEAEHRATHLVLNEVNFCRHLISEMGFNCQSVPVFTDSSTSLSQGKREGNAWSEGCKQYEIELSRAHSMGYEGSIVQLKIDTNDNPADLLTKSHMPSVEVRKRHVQRIGGNAEEAFESWIRRMLSGFTGTQASVSGLLDPKTFLKRCGLSK